MHFFQKCLEPDVSDKCEYPTFARTIPSPNSITRALFATLKKFNWRQFSILYEHTHDDVGQQLVESIRVCF